MQGDKQESAGQKDLADEQARKRHFMLAEVDKEMLEESLGAIRSDLGAITSDVTDPARFIRYKNLQAELIDQYKIGGDSAKAVLVVASTYVSANPGPRSGNGSADIYFFGSMQLSKAYPKAYICRETIREKIMDFFLRKETDFKEHKQFSKHFYLLTQEPEALRNLLHLAPLDELVKFPDLELELHEHDCFFRTDAKPVSPESAKELVQLAKLLGRILG